MCCMAWLLVKVDVVGVLYACLWAKVDVGMVYGLALLKVDVFGVLYDLFVG